jgi:hypothetical protein
VKGRDLLILLAIVLVGGFAVADALRSDDQRVEVRPTTTDRGGGPPTTSTVDDGDLGRAFFPTLNGAPGSIVLTQIGACPVREFDLPTGRELPNVVERSTCQLWAAPVTAKVAVGIGEPVGDAVPFRFLDLGHPNRDLGNSEAAFGFLVWSDDGQRAAWCNRRLEGIDLELDGPRRRLPGCPAAYTPDGEVALAEGNDLVVNGRTILTTASGGITNVHFGSDDSVAVVVDGRRIERHQGGRLTDALDLPERFEGRTPVLSRDNCGALLRAGDRIRLLDVGCLAPSLDLSFPGHVAAWSPDAVWIAVGGATELTFYNLESGTTTVWPIGVAQLVWRRS